MSKLTSVAKFKDLPWMLTPRVRLVVLKDILAANLFPVRSCWVSKAMLKAESPASLNSDDTAGLDASNDTSNCLI